MRFSRHAQKRMSQRGIKEHDFNFILAYGEQRYRDGVTEITLTNKAADQIIMAYKKQISAVEKMKNKSFIIDGDNVLTAFHGFKKWKEA